ncbi:MAG: hypothetical protein ABSD68_02300 [Candidatus Micrarchaeales archaeon]
MVTKPDRFSKIVSIVIISLFFGLSFGWFMDLGIFSGRAPLIDFNSAIIATIVLLIIQFALEYYKKSDLLNKASKAYE